MHAVRTSRMFVGGLLAVVCLFVITLFFLSPLFNISTVIIHGNYRVSDAQVLHHIGLGSGTGTPQPNIFLFNSRLARRQLLENNYFEEASISKRPLSGELHITLSERRLAGFFEFAPGQYLYIDEDGLVLSHATFLSENLPIVVGLEFSRFVLGQPLETTNARSFEHMVEMSRLLAYHGMASRVFRVDVNDSDNIRLFIDELEISFGDMSDADLKMQTIIEVLNHLETTMAGQRIRGSLDVSDANRHAILRHLT